MLDHKKTIQALSFRQKIPESPIGSHRDIYFLGIAALCFQFLCWLKICSGSFRQAFFHLGVKNSGRWSQQIGGRLIQ